MRKTINPSNSGFVVVLNESPEDFIRLIDLGVWRFETYNEHLRRNLKFVFDKDLCAYTCVTNLNFNEKLILCGLSRGAYILI